VRQKARGKEKERETKTTACLPSAVALASIGADILGRFAGGEEEESEPIVNFFLEEDSREKEIVVLFSLSLMLFLLLLLLVFVICKRPRQQLLQTKPTH